MSRAVSSYPHANKEEVNRYKGTARDALSTT